jgi:hypothetical protein
VILPGIYRRRPLPGFNKAVIKTTLTLIIGLVTLVQPISAKGRRDRPPVNPPAAETGHKVQIDLLLDTSNSMDGLIDQAKSQLWKVVNTFIDARRDGVPPPSWKSLC